MIDQKRVKGFIEHGVRFIASSGEGQIIGICPFCGEINTSRKGKFYVNTETLKWDCKVCGKAGDFQYFLTLIHETYVVSNRGKALSALSLNRGVSPQTIRTWGVGWSGLFYSIPIMGNPKRKITDLHRYAIGKKSLSTSGTGGNTSFIVPREYFGSKRIWLCEGEWDGMACWEMLQKLGINEDVVAVPGANTFPVKNAEMFYDRDVIIAYDRDKAGAAGASKAKNRLGTTAKSITFVHWPLEYENGFDLRDLYVKICKRDAKVTYANIKKWVHSDSPAYPDTLEESGANGTKAIKASVEAKVDGEESAPAPSGTGISAEEAEKRYKKWLEMKSTECLDVMFGVVFGNRIQGDPLWMFLVAPPGGMKSELIMSLSEAPLVRCIDGLTSHTLISGATFAGGSDPSLLPKLNNKVLAIKDFTSVLKMNSIAKDEIFGVLRYAYDGQAEKTFGHGILRKYHSKFGILAGVTSVVESLSAENSPLGERFLKYKLKQSGQDRVNVGKEAILRGLKNLRHSDTMRKELAGAGTAVLDRVVPEEDIPNLSNAMMMRFAGLAQWVASLRGVVSRERYTGVINFKPCAEIGTRLAKQLCKLAYGISMYRQEKEVSERTYQIIVTCAQDTAPDRVEELVKQLYVQEPKEYHLTKDIGLWTRFPEDTVRYLLQDLVLLGIVEKDPVTRGMWRITNRVRRLMSELRLYENEIHWKRGLRHVGVRKIK